jgi:AraC-like DNA-binding protein
MDPMTDVFTAIHVSSAVGARIEATAPWGLERQESDSAAVYAYAHFAYVARGNCYLRVGGGEAIPLVGGDCVLVAPNTEYVLGDQPHSRTVSFCEVAPPGVDGVMRLGGGGAPTTIVNGWFTLDQSSGRFTDLLPPVILIRADEPRSHALVTTLQMLSAELTSPAPGSPVIVTRLADILFIQALRAHAAAGSCTAKPRWLQALADPQIGKSLEAMHRAIGEPWTLATLASAAGMSRSAFAARFKALLGETPLEYLTRWRMETAGRLLREKGSKLYAIAKSVGYKGDAAFTRAFQRVFGVTPRSWRDQQVDRTRLVVRNEETTRSVDYNINGTAPVTMSIGPATH